MAKEYVNENWIHNCGKKGEMIEPKACSILDMGFSDDELKKLLAFYLFNSPTIKNSSDQKEKSIHGLKSLRDYGWVGNPSMNKLEGRLLSSSGINVFCFIKADSINNTLRAMNLFSDSICIEHPRAVIKQSYSVKIHEDGSSVISPTETRMECLFRHIRNSFAHNLMYFFSNKNIMLEDNENEQLSARILIPRDALIRWVDIVSNGPK